MGWEKGWEMTERTELSVEREKGFEPSTSTLARWQRLCGSQENRHDRAVTGRLDLPLDASSGYRRVGEGVGAP